MRPEDRIRLRHLTEAASKAIAYSASRQRADLDSDELLRLALSASGGIYFARLAHQRGNTDVPRELVAR